MLCDAPDSNRGSMPSSPYLRFNYQVNTVVVTENMTDITEFQRTEDL